MNLINRITTLKINRSNNVECSPHQNKQSSSKKTGDKSSRKRGSHGGRRKGAGAKLGNRNARGYGAPCGNRNAQKYEVIALTVDPTRDKRSCMKFCKFMIENLLSRKVSPRVAGTISTYTGMIIDLLIPHELEVQLDELEREQKALDKILADEIARRGVAARSKFVSKNNIRRSRQIKRKRKDSKGSTI